MLQWMGGSRRKVTTSRKSTQKRQKQYFEQRKRQQHQQTACQESYSDTTNTSSQRQNNSQSLDILSLQGLSTITQEHRSSFPSAREHLEGNVLTLNYQSTPCPPTMQTNKVSPADHIELKDSRASSIYPVKTVSAESALRVSMTSPSRHNKGLSRSDKVDHLKMTNDQQLSVFDLLGDDGPNGNLEGSLIHEAHVAFSVQGLGKVETETPVHSPQQPARYFPYDCSSPPEVARQAHSFENFYSRLDHVAPEVVQDSLREDNEITFYESDVPFSSRGMMNSFSYPKQKESAPKEFLEFNDNGHNLKNVFGNDEIFKSEDENEYIWDENYSLPNNDFLDESKCLLSSKNWPCQMDLNSADDFNFGNHVKKGFTFEGLDVPKNRVFAKATSRFNFLDSFSPCPKHQISEDHCNFATPDEMWYPKVGRNSVFGSTNQQEWSCFATKDTKESLSLLSEESCSSSAVWGEAIETQPSNLVGKKMRMHRHDLRSPISKRSMGNRYTQEAHCIKQDNLKLRENINGLRNCERMSSPTPTTTFQKKGPDKSWLFKDEDTTGNMNSGFGPFCQTSGVKESQPSGFQHWNGDLFNVYTVPKLQVDAKLSSETSKCDVPAEHSPCGSYFSEKLAFCQINPAETLFPSDHRSRSGKPNFSLNFDMECNPQDSFNDFCWQGDTKSPVITPRESGCLDGEKEPRIMQTESEELELQEDVCCGSNCSSSGNRITAVASDAGDSCSHFKEAKATTPEMMESLKATCSPEHAESSVEGLEAPDNIESCLEGKEYQDNIQSHPSQNGCEEIDDSRPKERNMESKSADPSCQEMMLQSYVLQLLCVNVLKETSTLGTGKQVCTSLPLTDVGLLLNHASEMRCC